MSFGTTIRELLSASYREDLQRARATRPLPEVSQSGALHDLAGRLERAFGVEISADDLQRLGTVRDVLQCVRLRLWERRVGLGAATDDVVPHAAERAVAARAAAAPVAAHAAEHPVALTGEDLRRRFRRYEPAAPHQPMRPLDGRSKRL